MAQDAIINKIKDKAHLEIKEIQAEGERRAETEAQKVREAAKENADRILERGRQEAEEIINREKLKADMECRKNTLAAKRKMIDEAFRRALDKLCTLEGDEWEQMAEKLVLEECIPGEVEVCLSAKDTQRLGKQFSKLLSAWEKKLNEKHQDTTYKLLAGEAVPIQGGLFFRGATCDVDASFEMLLRDVREAREYEIAMNLFEGEDKHE